MAFPLLFQSKNALKSLAEITQLVLGSMITLQRTVYIL